MEDEGGRYGRLMDGGGMMDGLIDGWREGGRVMNG